MGSKVFHFFLRRKKRENPRKYVFIAIASKTESLLLGDIPCIFFRSYFSYSDRPILLDDRGDLCIAVVKARLAKARLAKARLPSTVGLGDLPMPPE